MQIAIGVSHNPSTLPIILGTQALFSRFVMGPKAPATHAFVVAFPEGTERGLAYLMSGAAFGWRLDGEPSGARWSPYTPGSRAQQEALWLLGVSEDQARAGVATARRLDRTEYDWVEIAASAAAAFSALPWLRKLQQVGSLDVMKAHMICTKVAMVSAGGCSPQVDDAVRKGMPDLFPERLGQLLRSWETGPTVPGNATGGPILTWRL